MTRQKIMPKRRGCIETTYKYSPGRLTWMNRASKVVRERQQEGVCSCARNEQAPTQAFSVSCLSGRRGTRASADLCAPNHAEHAAGAPARTGAAFDTRSRD